MSEKPRYAIYYAPPDDSALWRFGSSVIGHDAQTGLDVPQPVIPGIADWPDLTAEPRRYGFHATLKAPFHLAEGQDEAGLLDAMVQFAEHTSPAPLDGLTVRTIGSFLALTPVGGIDALMALASNIVTEFEPFRAPLSPDDRARRLLAPLTSRQVWNLDRFGYPYVHSEFRFHMTLSGSLPDAVRATAQTQLAGMFGQSGADTPRAIDEISLFRQDNRTSRFRIIARVPLHGRTR